MVSLCKCQNINNTVIAEVRIDDAVLYPNPYITVTPQGYTKHYFAEHERIATSEGNGHWMYNHPVQLITQEHDIYISGHTFGSFDHYPLGKEGIGRPTSNVDIHSQSHDIIQYCDSSLVLASINLQYHELLKKTMGYYTTNQDGNEDIYFYHGNHLGSASWITEHHGDPIQYIHYLPYGEILANQHTTYNERFKFTGKELDGESGYYYFGARYLLSELGNFISSDPLTDKNLHLSSYMYCHGNPIRYIDPDGERPIYSTDGELMGTDENGLQGLAIVMKHENFSQNMSSENAAKFDMGITVLSKNAYQKYYESYNNLSSRPDWDGYITLNEANDWYRNGNGSPLFADLRKIDMSRIYSLGEKFVGQEMSVNLLTNSESTETGLVYGNITLKRYPHHQVKAYSDTYNFEMHNWYNPLNWGRNIETIIGNKVAGLGVPYDIHFYGSQTLTPILPWIK